MTINEWLVKVEERFARWGLPAGPDSLINHKVILGVLAGIIGALLAWVVSDPYTIGRAFSQQYREDIPFLWDFVILSAVGFFVCLFVMSAESVFDKDLRTVVRNLLFSAFYCGVIVIPVVLMVKLLLGTPQSENPPSTKVFVLDTSGSMKDYPLDTLKKALRSYVDTIEKRGANGRVSLACVSFDTNARVISSPTTDYRTFRAAVERLEASGITNMPEGLKLAQNFVANSGPHSSAQTVNALPVRNLRGHGASAACELFLVSDGQPLLRPPRTQTREAIEEVLAEGKRQTLDALSFYTRNRIPINTVGAGKDYDRDLMKTIADNTGGLFVPADDISQLIPILQKAAEQALTGLGDRSQSTLSVWTRTLGWSLIGMAIGICASFLRRSSKRSILGTIPLPEISARMMLFGLVGGFVGGMCGALAFESLHFLWSLTGIKSGVVNRLVGFTLLGGFVGFFVNCAQAAAKKAWIRIIRGTGEGRLFVLDRTPMVLGRSEMADIPICGDVSLADESLRFASTGAGYRVGTIGSMSLAVNGMPVSEALLKHNDSFSVGNTEFVYSTKIKT